MSDFPCLHGKSDECLVCDAVDLRFATIIDMIPFEIWQHEIFKHLNRSEQLSVMLSCKILYERCKQRKKHTDKYRECPVCLGRIRVQKLYNKGSKGITAACGCVMHIRCQYYCYAMEQLYYDHKTCRQVYPKTVEEAYELWVAKYKPPKKFIQHICSGRL